jgi:hypothetical protein
MTRCGGERRPVRAIVCAMTAAMIAAATHDAAAFDIKHTSGGQPVHWNASQVDYVVDPSVERRVPGGAAAVSIAVRGWSHEAGGPALTTSVGAGEAKPGLDGQNSVILAPLGFAAAGDALAVTVTSYDNTSGNIVDSDIVINGLHAFAVLDATARPASGAYPIATDGPSDDDDTLRPAPFDLVHVVSHEVGHTLGLADENDDHTSLMYAFTAPGDASIRAPSNDDIDGVDALYGGEGSAGSSRGAGCGQSSVAGSRTRPADAWFVLALVVGAAVRLASPRRARVVVRISLPLGGALVALLACPNPARSATPGPTFAADAIARVATASTSNVGGLFQTTLDLVPTACKHDPCPARARVQAWGGTLGGITQRIGGGIEMPAVGEVVDIAFVGGAPDSSEASVAHGVARADDVPQAAVVAVRH